MTPEKPPFGTIPTLTEVVPWPEAVPVAPLGPGNPSASAVERPGIPPPAPAVADASKPGASIAPAAAASEPVGRAPAFSEAQLAERVMADLQKQIDLMLEVRLREALAPVLARAGDALVRDARRELTAALRDVVTRAVARELGEPDKSQRAAGPSG